MASLRFQYCWGLWYSAGAAGRAVVQGWGRIGRGVLFLLVYGYFSACTSGLYHQVRPGETLSGIAQLYGVSYQEIARLNDLRNPHRIEVGQQLRIPQAGQARPVALATPEKREALPPFPRDEGAFFAWPVDGELTSGFGPRNGSSHDGIDIAAPRGTAVVAAADGQVIFSDVLRGYGNVVIVRHGNGYTTVYAHNRVNLVKEGQVVRQGQRLAEVGDSGRATGSNLHFEVRKNNLARDPLRYLPQDRRTVLRNLSP